MRVALWDHADTPTAIFTGNPGLGAMGRRDFVAWVSSGRNVVFTGGYRQLAAMNELFGFALEEVPKPRVAALVSREDSKADAAEPPQVREQLACTAR